MTQDDAQAYLKWRERFAEAIDTDLYPMQWLDKHLASDVAWIVYRDDAAVVFEWKRYPSGVSYLHGLVSAGNLRTLADDIIAKEVEKAQGAGAAGALVESRMGWVKVLKGQGFEPYQVAARKVF